MLAGTGTGMERDYDFSTAVWGADLEDPKKIGTSAGERAVKRLNARKVPTCQAPVVFDPSVAGGMLRHLVGAISGPAIARGTSFLKDRLGQRIFPAGISIIDDPHRRRGLRAKPFDGEGVRNARRALVEDGVLKTWLLDVRSGRQLGLASTGHASRGTSGPPAPAPTNLYLEPGAVTAQELIADIEGGFYVTELMGMGVNGVTGDYSRGAAGFWIEHGEIAFPVSELTIAGNLKEMFLHLTPGQRSHVQDRHRRADPAHRRHDRGGRLSAATRRSRSGRSASLMRAGRCARISPSTCTGAPAGPPSSIDSGGRYGHVALTGERPRHHRRQIAQGRAAARLGKAHRVERRPVEARLRRQDEAPAVEMRARHDERGRARTRAIDDSVEALRSIAGEQREARRDVGELAEPALRGEIEMRHHLGVEADAGHQQKPPRLVPFGATGFRRESPSRAGAKAAIWASAPTLARQAQLGRQHIGGAERQDRQRQRRRARARSPPR